VGRRVEGGDRRGRGGGSGRGREGRGRRRRREGGREGSHGK